MWHGDLTDDCWAKVGNLLAHCECLGEIRWCDEDENRTKHKSEYWHVSVGPVNRKHFSTGDDIFHSGEPGGLILGGTMARAIAEAILKSSNAPLQASGTDGQPMKPKRDPALPASGG